MEAGPPACPEDEPQKAMLVGTVTAMWDKGWPARYDLHAHGPGSGGAPPQDWCWPLARHLRPGPEQDPAALAPGLRRAAQTNPPARRSLLTLAGKASKSVSHACRPMGPQRQLPRNVTEGGGGMSARVCGTWRTPGCWRGLRKPGSNSPRCHAHGSDQASAPEPLRREAGHVCPSPLGLEKLLGEAASSKGLG